MLKCTLLHRTRISGEIILLQIHNCCETYNLKLLSISNTISNIEFLLFKKQIKEKGEKMLDNPQNYFIIKYKSFDCTDNLLKLLSTMLKMRLRHGE